MRTIPLTMINNRSTGLISSLFFSLTILSNTFTFGERTLDRSTRKCKKYLAQLIFAWKKAHKIKSAKMIQVLRTIFFFQIKQFQAPNLGHSFGSSFLLGKLQFNTVNRFICVRFRFTTQRNNLRILCQLYVRLEHTRFHSLNTG